MSIATTPSAPPVTNQNGQSLATRAPAKFEPMAPIGTAGGLKSLLETMKGSIAQALPKHVTPERLIKTLLVAANRNPGLLKCTQASILETINRAAELGLDLSGTLGEAYPVPFNNSIKNADGSWSKISQCTLIIGYRGLEKLAWQSGEVKMIDAEVVCENDRFVFRKGFEPVLEWEPAKGDRGEPIGAYACIITKNEGRMARFMTTADIEKVRAGAQSKDSPAWKNHWSEMARKTVLRRTMKDAPLSTEKLVAAMEHDDTDHKLVDVLEAETGLAGLPAGRSSFKETPAPQQAQDGEGDPQGDDQEGGTGGVHVGEVVDTEVSKAAAAVEKRRAEAKQAAGNPAPAPVVADQPKARWPMNPKTDKVSSVGYWRAQLVKVAGLHLSNAPREGVTGETLVQRLEDGDLAVLPAGLPCPDDGIPAPEVVNAYRQAKHTMEGTPAAWDDPV